MQTLIYNATLVLAERLIEDGWLLIEDTKIGGLGEAATCPAIIERRIDAGGNFVLPGLIDLHCDAIEKLVEPRPNVHFEVSLALAEADLRLAGCGITTEFHAVSLDDREFGVRAVNFIVDFAQAIQAQSNSLIRHEIHARLEVTSVKGFEMISGLIKARAVRLVSLMDHSPGQGQYTTEEAYREYVKRTAHMSDAEIDEILEMKREQAAHVPGRIEAVAKLVREAGLALATHDDDDPAKVEQWPGLGVTIAEFPTTIEAARRAHELGLAVCMGAPNVVRGKSSGGNLSATAAIEAGVADTLCADYYPSAMLTAIFRLAKQNIMSLPQATRTVTLNPAKAVGLGSERGSLEVGKLADLIVVALNGQNIPGVQRVFVGGAEKLTVTA